MKTVIIVSKCQRVIRSPSGESWFQFQFRGVYSGEIIKKVALRGSPAHIIERGGDYLIHVQVVAVQNGVFKGLILKLKALDECWDKS